MRTLSIPRRKPTPRTAASASKVHVACQVCGCAKNLEDVIALFQDERVVFAVCHACTRAHDIVMRPSGTGVQVLAKLRGAA